MQIHYFTLFSMSCLEIFSLQLNHKVLKLYIYLLLFNGTQGKGTHYMNAYRWKLSGRES